MDTGVLIKEYHADNGTFRSNDWQKVCRDERQQLNLLEINSHFKNGMAEKRIRDLQDLTQTELIYSFIKWKGCIIADL